MPQHFAKNENSNNYNLLKIIAQNSEDNRLVYDTILKFWDVDTAIGVGLDRLGKDGGISRGSWDDEEYRKMIKIQCILNLSEGDINTMNQILDVYMEKGFIGLQDGWSDFEPASLIVNLTSNASSFPESIGKRIKSAGVRLYILLNELLEKLLLSGDTYAWQIGGRITSRFKTGSKPAAIGKEIIGIKDDIYAFETKARVCGRFRAGGAL